MPDIKRGQREQVLRRARRTCEYCRAMERYSPDPLSRRQRWLDHFAWSLDFTRIVGITPTGRATVELLRLNRAGLVNIRLVLRKEGVHPPPGVNEPLETKD